MELGAFGGRVGIAKLLTIVLGVITLGLTADGYYKVGKDEAYLACVIICFIVSFLYVVAVYFNLINQSETTKKMDMVFHMIAFIFYAITLLLFLISLIDYPSRNPSIKHKLAVRVFAFIFGVLTCLLYGAISFFLYKDL